MCHNSVKSYTNSRFIVRNQPFQLVNYFPCGYCSDCIRKKRSEWSMRSYYEAMDCFSKSKSNFVLFDTLTYSDNNLRYFHDIYKPALFNCWDFMSFSRKDIKDFFKRLRINLYRGCVVDTSEFKSFGYYGKSTKIKLPAFPDSLNNLRYLLTSEYGTSEGCSHRPHYHILFFVNFKIDPELFSLFVAHSWKFGRTDGIPYKHKWYVLNERTIRATSPNKMKLINYVSKYIGKDMYLYRKLFRRVFISFSLANPNWQLSYKKRLEFRRFKNQVMPFHVQSLGFGFAALRFEDQNYIDEFNAIRMPVSSKGVVASIPLSTYFKRKLFFDCVEILGRLTWLPNQKYLDNKIRRFNKSVGYLSESIFSWDCRLGKQKCIDIAKYHLLWRGLSMPKQLININDDDLLKLRYKTKDEFFVLDMDKLKVQFTLPMLFGFSTEVDSYRFGRYISDSYIPYYNDTLYSRYKVRSKVCNCWRCSDFEKRPPEDLVVINQNSLSRFNGYDDILESFFFDLKKEGDFKDYEMFVNDRQLDRYKQLSLI